MIEFIFIEFVNVVLCGIDEYLWEDSDDDVVYSDEFDDDYLEGGEGNLGDIIKQVNCQCQF